MRFLKLSAISVAIILIVAGVIGLMMSKEYSVSRSISINASNELIHEFVGNLENWEQWTTWKLDDPTMIIFKGIKSQGVGATQSWKGSSGEGRLEFTASSVKKGIEYDLYFDESDLTANSSFTYSNDKANPSITIVTWKMTGAIDVPILGSYFAMMMDGMIGTMFDRGLSRLKSVTEKKS